MVEVLVFLSLVLLLVPRNLSSKYRTLSKTCKICFVLKSASLLKILALVDSRMKDANRVPGQLCKFPGHYQ